MMGYDILTYEQARQRLGEEHLAQQLAALTTECFSTFEGVLQPSLPATRWYVTRPGLDRSLSHMALADRRIVSNVYLTRLRFPVGGRMFDVGMIDTVMTHPAHRQQGLARRLLTQALDRLRASGAAGAALCTPPGSLPFSIYERMGFRLYRPCLIWTLERALSADGAQDIETSASQTSDAQEIRALINRFNAARDGFVTLDESLWDWRKLTRPAHMPATVMTAHRAGQLVGALTFCPVDLVAASGPIRYMYLTDLGLTEDRPVEALALLLRASPPAARWIMLASERDQELNALLKRMGFVSAPTEGLLALPFDPTFRQALEASPRAWYVLPESVVGI
jgi:GNAT superfamily N-acetyltransferase